MATDVKLAELLLRRKELNEKVSQLKPINISGLFVMKQTRKAVGENFDDISSTVPILRPADVTAEFDYYASQLRQVDALIQQANWNTVVAIDPVLMKPYTSPAI